MPVPLLLVEPGTGRILRANKAADRLAGGTFPKENPEELFHSRFFCTDSTGARVHKQNLPWLRAARGEPLDGYQIDCLSHSGPRSLIIHAGTLPASEGEPAVVML